jgi:hypothetical protein
MAGRPPKTDHWTARENKHGKRVLLIVSGLVQVTNLNQTPRLKEAVPQGINPKILILSLTIETSGTGAAVVVWKRATFTKVVRVGQYDSIDVHWEGKSIATCPVLSDDEHHQYLVKLTQDANAKYQKPKAPPAPVVKAAPAPAAKAKSAPKPKAKPKSKAKPKPKTKAKARAKPKSKSKPAAKRAPKAKSKSKTATRRAPKAKSKAKAKPKSKAKKKRAGALSSLLRAVGYRRK